MITGQDLWEVSADSLPASCPLRIGGVTLLLAGESTAAQSAAEAPEGWQEEGP